MAEDNARKSLELDIANRRALRFRKTAHLLLRKLDVVTLLRRHTIDAGSDFIGLQPKTASLKIVEPLRQFANRRIPALPNLAQQRLDILGDAQVPRRVFN